MTSVALAVYRLASRAYPKHFREAFEADLLQLFTDHRRHGGRRSGVLLARELVDLVPNAVRLRGESPMTRPVLRRRRLGGLAENALLGYWCRDC